jgi:microcystin-dependent protein
MPVSGAAYIGEISMFAFTYSPQDWLSCNGSLISISQNTALFALLGDSFGGDARVTFGLPNMNSRAPVGHFAGGSSMGLTQYRLGQIDGAPHVNLRPDNLPAHTHAATFVPTSTPATASLSVYVSGADKATPVAGDLIAGSGVTRFRAAGGFGEPAKVPLGGIETDEGQITGRVTIEHTGGDAPVDILSPVLAVNFSICATGLFPPRP